MISRYLFRLPSSCFLILISNGQAGHDLLEFMKWKKQWFFIESRKTKIKSNRPFPSSLVPLFQSESKCETILMKMTLISMKMKWYSELILTWKVSHLDSFWNRGTGELGNGLLLWPGHWKGIQTIQWNKANLEQSTWNRHKSAGKCMSESCLI